MTRATNPPELSPESSCRRTLQKLAKRLAGDGELTQTRDTVARVSESHVRESLAEKSVSSIDEV